MPCAYSRFTSRRCTGLIGATIKWRSATKDLRANAPGDLRVRGRVLVHHAEERHAADRIEEVEVDADGLRDSEPETPAIPGPSCAPAVDPCAPRPSINHERPV